jgi:hypothetical protein
MPEVLDLVASGRASLELVSGSPRPWDDAPEAFAAGGGKAVLCRA